MIVRKSALRGVNTPCILPDSSPFVPDGAKYPLHFLFIALAAAPEIIVHKTENQHTAFARDEVTAETMYGCHGTRFGKHKRPLPGYFVAIPAGNGA